MVSGFLQVCVCNTIRIAMKNEYMSCKFHRNALKINVLKVKSLIEDYNYERLGNLSI